MRESTAARVLALAAVCLVTAGCSSGGSAGTSTDPSAPAPIAWSVVQALATAPTGSYEKRTTERADGKDQILVSEWVDYDLDKKIIDRRIGLGDDPSTKAVEAPGTRDAPSLRFVLQADGTTMWNPAAKATCGTPWVKMPADQTPGADPATAFVGVEPTLLLRQVAGTPSVLGNDATQTVYVVGVNGVAGVPTSALQKQPTIAAELAQQSTPGTVTVARDGKSATLTVDVTNALTKLGNPAGSGTVVVSWHLGALDHAVSGVGSAKVADSSCMG